MALADSEAQCRACSSLTTCRVHLAPYARRVSWRHLRSLGLRSDSSLSCYLRAQQAHLQSHRLESLACDSWRHQDPVARFFCQSLYEQVSHPAALFTELLQSTYQALPQALVPCLAVSACALAWFRQEFERTRTRDL